MKTERSSETKKKENIFYKFMLLINLQRIIKSGLISFWRNVWVSTAAIAIMVLSLLTISGLLLSNAITDSLLNNLESKVDVSVYFKQGAEEEEVLKVKTELADLGEVKTVDYISSEDALKEFKIKHKDDSVLMQSLQELDGNPLESSINIKAKQASQYEAISLFLENGKYKNLITKVDFKQNQKMIDRLVSIVATARSAGIGISLGLIFIAVLVTFNTIRFAIYTAKEEISVMRLVGASNWYIGGPFVVEGILYGLVGSILALIIFAPLISNISPFLYNFTQTIDIWQYFKDNFWAIFMFQTGFGIFLGILSSVVAIRRYLKV